MNVASENNFVLQDISKTISWQYDSAANLIRSLLLLADFESVASGTFWDNWPTNVININTANDFGLALWGKILSCKRPYVTIDNEKVILDKEVYRNILKARFLIYNGNCTTEEYVKILNSLFSIPISISDGLFMDMSVSCNVTGMELTNTQKHEVAVVNQYLDLFFVYPAGVKNNDRIDGKIFGFDGQNTNRRTNINIIINGTPGVVIPSTVTMIYNNITFSIFDQSSQIKIGEDGNVEIHFVSSSLLNTVINPYSITSQNLTGLPQGVSYAENRTSSYNDMEIGTMNDEDLENDDSENDDNVDDDKCGFIWYNI